MVYLGGFSVLISLIGLYILLIFSFSPRKKKKNKGEFIQKSARKIRVHHSQPSIQTLTKSHQINPRVILLLETIVIGEVVGLFFLLLSNDPFKYKILAYNAAFLLIASFLCSVLTLLNAWFKKKTHIAFRVSLQAITLIVGIILFRLAMSGKSVKESISIVKAGVYMQMAIYGYFITVVVAIVTMLYIALKGDTENNEELEFSNYLMLVIMSGLLIGSGLLLAYSIKFITV